MPDSRAPAEKWQKGSVGSMLRAGGGYVWWRYLRPSRIKGLRPRSSAYLGPMLGLCRPYVGLC